MTVTLVVRKKGGALAATLELPVELSLAPFSLTFCGLASFALSLKAHFSLNICDLSSFALSLKTFPVPPLLAFGTFERCSLIAFGTFKRRLSIKQLSLLPPSLLFFCTQAACHFLLQAPCLVGSTCCRLTGFVHGVHFGHNGVDLSELYHPLE